MDFKAFKKVADDGKVVTLRHEKGHEVRIVKHAVDRKTRNALQSLPHHAAETESNYAAGGNVENEKLHVANNYDEGGDVGKPQSPVVINVGGQGQQPPAPEAPAQPEPTTAQSVGQTIGSGLKTIAEHTPIAYGIRAAKAAAPYVKEGLQGLTAGVTGTPVSSDDSSQSAPQPQEAQASAPQNYNPPQQAAPQANPLMPDATMSAPQAAPADHSMQMQQQVIGRYTDRMKALDAEHDALVQDIHDHHVDPNHLWNQKSGLDKVASTVGLLLGGITGNKGLLGTYGRLVQNQIDEDVASQQSDLGNKKTLLEANMKQYGNAKDAADAARLGLAAAVTAKLQGSEGFKNNLEAQKLQMEMDQYRQQIMQTNAIRHAIQQPNALTDPNIKSIAVRALVPEKQQEQAFKELGGLEGMKTLGEDALNSFDKVNHMFGAGLLSPHARDAEIQPVLAKMVRDSEGRVTPQDTKMIEALFPRAGDAEDTRALKRQKLTSFLTAKMQSPILSAYFIPPPKMNTMQRIPTPAGWKK